MYKFPVALLTYCDPHGHGRPGGIVVECFYGDKSETNIAIPVVKVVL